MSLTRVYAGASFIEAHRADLRKVSWALACGAGEGVWRGAQLLPARLHYVPEKGVLRDEEVAGIDVAVALDDHMPVAPFAEDALRRDSGADVDKRVLYVPDEYASGVAVRSPCIEDTAEEVVPLFRRDVA